MKEEYAAMRREMKQGYGQHSFEQGMSVDEMRIECVRILHANKCYPADTIGEIMLNRNKYNTKQTIGQFIKSCSYGQLEQIYLSLLMFRRPSSIT